MAEMIGDNFYKVLGGISLVIFYIGYSFLSKQQSKEDDKKLVAVMKDIEEKKAKEQEITNQEDSTS